MKKNIIKTTLLALLACSANSCIEETFPESSTVTADQLPSMSNGTEGLVNAILEKFITVNTTYSSQEFDLGYPGLGMIRDVHCSDFPSYTLNYDYFYYFRDNTYLGGNYVTAYFPWSFYYSLIGLTNNVLRLEYSDNIRADLGVAHFFRAWAYFDVARWYEYKKTGVASLDAKAEESGIYGLTVPILTENSTETEARYTPRATSYEMYRFLLDDLDKAETYLTGISRSAKNRPDVSTVYGMKARVYLDMASRFAQSPDELDAYLASETDLGVATAKECYEKAATYARDAITFSGATPLTETEWYGGSSYTDGFNSVTSNSWMLGAIVTKENLNSSYEWRNFIGHMSPEQSWGVGGGITADGSKYIDQYMTERCISSYLYSQIGDKDWRKATWIAPEDAGKAPGGKYKTNVPDEYFKVLPAYTNFKFRPKNGERADYSVGAAADYPLMRVEEMYFIEAEALAGSQGVSVGAAALKSFVETYRYKDNATYECASGSMDRFIKDLMIQKRIEFWGEGLVFWDYKRLNLQVVRGYEGTNFSTDEVRLNSYEGYCAPWLNGFIPTDEYGMNTAIIPNPDCSNSIPFWTEN